MADFPRADGAPGGTRQVTQDSAVVVGAEELPEDSEQTSKIFYGYWLIGAAFVAKLISV